MGIDRRSGKTFSLCIKSLQLSNENELPGIICEPVYPMITRVLIPTMNELLYKLNIKFVLNKSDGYYDIFFNNIPKRIWLLSAENIQRAAGISASWAGIDEVDLMKKELAKTATNMLVSRLTRGKQMQMIFTSTPEGYNMLYDFFIENAGNDRRLIKARTIDNPFIDATYVANLQQTHSEQQLKAYLDGEFVNLSSGSVYYNFSRKIHHSDRIVLPSDKTLLIGQDFNWNNNTSVVMVYEHEKLHVVNEITGAQNTEHTIELIKSIYPDKNIWIFPDASGNNHSSKTSNSDISLLQKAGFTIKCHNKNPFVKDRVASVNALLKNAKGDIRLHVNTKICKQLTKSLEQQSYDLKTGAPDKTSGLDHCFSGDTLIETLDQGIIKFSEINKTGYVLSPKNEWVYYENAGIIKSTSDIVEINFENGYTIKCTSDHKFLTKELEWIEAQYLLNKTCLFTVTQNKHSMVKIFTYVENILAKVIELVKRDYIEWFMNITTEKFQKVMIFITRTIINQIMKLKILNVYYDMPIINITVILKKIKNVLEYYKNTQFYLLLNGINQRMEGNGIKNIMRSIKNLYINGIQQNVQIVVKNLNKYYQNNIAKITSVRKTVKHHIEENPGLMTKEEYVKNVIQNSSHTSIMVGNIVKSVIHKKENLNVYCLTVPSIGCFKLKSDGPVVSNCVDSLGYPCHYLFPITGKSTAKQIF